MSSEDKSQLILSRQEADRATYNKLFELAQTVFQDPNSRLPYIPTFIRRRRNLQEQFNFLEETVPKVFQARGEEFCLQSCNNSSSDCMKECREFTFKAFEAGNKLFAGLHKPYVYTKPTIDLQDE